MSFDKLSKKELVDVADKFGADSSGTKADILASLEAEGVDWELYETLTANATPLEVEPEKPAPATTRPRSLPSKKEAPVADEDGVILAYRGAASQTVREYRWTKDSPYVVVPADEAEAIIAKYGWVFEKAGVKEVEDFFS